MIRMQKKSAEVYLAAGQIPRVARSEIEFLKQKLQDSSRGRVRLCAHPGNEDLLHEMFIVMSRATYIRPHRHGNKSESFHIIEGLVDVVIFDNEGAITEVVALGDLQSGHDFFYRLSLSAYHTLVIHSQLVVIHEITNGPFRPGDAEFAPWAPDEADQPAYRKFVEELAIRTKVFSAKK